VNSPAVKEEFVWPDVEWNDAVIDLEEQHDLLTAWQSGSEEESSGCSDSSGSNDFEWTWMKRMKQKFQGVVA
jgi:hypothetical protein